MFIKKIVTFFVIALFAAIYAMSEIYAQDVNAILTVKNIGADSTFGTYATGIYDKGAAKIAVHDPISQKHFVVNSANSIIEDGAVEVYADANYGRFYKSYKIPSPRSSFNIDTLDDYNNEISSIRVGKGIKVSLFNETGQNGYKIVLYEGDYKHLRDWNDSVDSMKIEKVDPDLPLIILNYSDNDIQKIGLAGTDELSVDANFLVNNGAVSVDIPKEYSVTFYQHPNYKGHQNQETLFNDGEDLKRYSLKTYGLDNNLSSLKIAWMRYMLTKVVITPIGTPDYSAGEPMASQVRCINDTPAEFTCNKTIESRYEASSTTSWDNSTSLGITSTTTVKAEAGVLLAKAGIEQSIAVSLSDTLSFGKSETKVTSQTFSDTGSIKLAPGQSAAFNIFITVETIKYKVTSTYSPVDADGNVTNGTTKDVTGTLTVKKASSTDARATIIGSASQTNNSSNTTNVSSNVALNKPATQSSSLMPDLPASKAVDGNTLGTFSAKDFTHTKDEEGGWWQVDLGRVHDIDKIVIWNRTDCCWERLQNFYVMVSETPIQSNSTTKNMLFSGPHSFTSATDASMNIEGIKKGRYVRIFLKNGTNPLSLAEVQVFGR